MRNRALHDSLRAFAEQAHEHLTAALESGAEIPFEVAESPGARSVLYHYRPLSAQFVRERFPGLRSLPAFDGALRGLEAIEGVSAYLRVMGAAYVPAAERDRAEATLREVMARLWAETTSFELEERAFERAYGELESIVYEDTVVNAVVAPLQGVRLAEERWELGSGIELIRGDLSDAPPEAVWASSREHDEPNAIASLTVEATPQEPPPLTVARASFRRVLTALRLLRPGSASLGAQAWWRTDEGPWQSVPLGFSGRARGSSFMLEATDRAELGELFEILRSRPAIAGPLPWALARFEVGCEQLVALDALSDHLLALRALLDGGEPGTVGMALRLAALCSEPSDHAVVKEQVERAFRLERLAMRGDVDVGALASIGIDSTDAVVRELEDCLRTLLREMVRGDVAGDVRRVADELMGTSDASVPEPGLFARTTPLADPLRDAWDALTSDTPVERLTEAPDPAFVVKRMTGEQPSEEPTQEAPAAGVAAHGRAPEEGDWGFDDDAADYSGAV